MRVEVRVEVRDMGAIKKAGLLGPAFLLVVVLFSCLRSVTDDGEAPLAVAVGELDGVHAGGEVAQVDGLAA